jgi:hypothetical protein
VELFFFTLFVRMPVPAASLLPLHIIINQVTTFLPLLTPPSFSLLQGRNIFIVFTIMSLFVVGSVSYWCFLQSQDREPKFFRSKQMGGMNGQVAPIFKPCVGGSELDKIFGAVSLILVVSGFATLAAWCGQMLIVQNHEYHGPMQVTGTLEESGNLKLNKFTYEYDCYQRSYECGTSDKKRTCYEEVCKTGYYEAARGELSVGWGGAWGCPKHAQKSCTSDEVVSSCDVKVCSTQTHNGGKCSDAERNAAELSVNQCLARKFNAGVTIPTVTFDEALGLDDPSLVYADLYGDCDVCSAKFTVPIGAARRNRVAGFIVLWVGLSLWGVFLFRNGLCGMCFGWDGDMPYPVWMQHPSAWKSHVQPSKYYPKMEKLQQVHLASKAVSGDML